MVASQRTAVFGLALALLALGLVPTAAAREESETYITGADAVASCEDEVLGGLADRNLGSVCFDVEPGESSVDVRIDDDVTLNVGGVVQFYDDSGGTIGSTVGFCTTTSAPVDIPSGAERVEVFVDGPAFNAIQNHCSQPTTSTIGDVTATFS